MKQNKRTNIRVGGGYPLLNNGFTLIELLAVIVILAIIALIAIPMISKIIDKTEDSAALRSAELYIDGVNQAIMRANLNNKFRPKECIIQEDGNLICDGETELKIEATGSKPTAGTLEIEDRRVKSFTGMIIDIYELEMNEDGKIVVTGTLEEPEEPADYIDLTGAMVDLLKGLTPVIYSNNNWVVANVKDQWYNYDNQEWANAVVLKSNVTKNVGDTIDITNEVQGMFVYIPRYEYKIEGTYGTHIDGTLGTQTLPGEIKVNFLSKEKTTANEGYIIHPAFKFGETELNGIWVGKFSTSTDKNSTCYTSESEANCNDAVPYVLPSVKSLKFQNVSTQFATAKKFNNYLNNESLDSHMAKNSEWGAVAYLSQSKYGKYGNANYIGAEKQIMINNCSNHITGIGADLQNAAGSISTCAINTYETAKGQTASTTGNIMGIYDMNGGAFENVMAVFSKSVGGSGFTVLPEEKYYNNYTGTSTATPACNGGICYGHALSETWGWYSDEVGIPTDSANPWLCRGGYYDSKAESGIFASRRTNGNMGTNQSFRVVITNS